MVKRSQDGHALLLALLIIVLTMAAVALIASALDLRLRLLRQEAQNLQLTALCDAALAQALAELEANAFYKGTGTPVPFADGTLTTTIHSLDSRRVKVAVLATYAGRRRRALAVVRLDPPVVIGWRPVAP